MYYIIMTYTLYTIATYTVWLRFSLFEVQHWPGLSGGLVDQDRLERVEADA